MDMSFMEASLLSESFKIIQNAFLRKPVSEFEERARKHKAKLKVLLRKVYIENGKAFKKIIWIS